MAGSLVGAALAGLTLAPKLSLPLVALACLVPALLAVRALPGHEAAAVPDKDVAGKQRLGLPSVALLGICLFVFGITLTEGAMADWSAIYMRDVLAVDAATAGLGYSVFALLVAAGRFSGDRLKARFGASALARGCGLLGLVGAALLLVAPNIAVALIGFATIGVGVSVGFPLAVSAVAGLPGSSARSVAVLSFVALLGFLVGPVVIGVVAEHVGLRVGLAALLPVLLLSLLLSGRLRLPPAAAGLVEESSAGSD
jgi:MFS family permease